MPEISSPSIIWHIRPYKEADALVTLLSEAEGKITLLARGLRSAKSKRKGTIQPFSCLRIWHTIPRNEQGLGVLTKSEFQCAPKASDPIVLAQLALVSEVSSRFLAEKQPAPQVFALWQEMIRMSFRRPYVEVCASIVKILSIVGMFPNFQICTKCGEKFSQEKQIVWENGEGIYCCDHSAFADTSPVHKILTFEQLKVMSFFQCFALADAQKLVLSSQQSQVLMESIFQEMSAFSDKPFVTKKIFEELMCMVR